MDTLYDYTSFLAKIKFLQSKWLLFDKIYIANEFDVVEKPCLDTHMTIVVAILKSKYYRKYQKGRAQKQQRPYFISSMFGKIIVYTITELLSPL